MDARADKLLARVFPLDRSKNASGHRRLIERPSAPDHQAATDSDELPPLLEKHLQDYAATGLPPSYLPKGDGSGNKDKPTDDERKD